MEAASVRRLLTYRVRRGRILFGLIAGVSAIFMGLAFIAVDGKSWASWRARQHGVSRQRASRLGPNAVIDGDLTTRWASAWKSDPQWVMIDLGKSESINRVKLTWEASYAKSYELQVSDDGVKWTDIYQTSDGKGGVEDLTGLIGQGRYIRLYGTKRATRFGYSLYEFEVYGPGQPAN